LPADSIAKSIDYSAQTLSVTPKIDVNQLLQHITTDAAGIVLPVLELVPVAPEEGTFEGELIRESISCAPRLGGAAVFKRDRLVGFFSPTEARGRQWVLGEAAQAIMTVPHPHSDGKQVSLTVMANSSRITFILLSSNCCSGIHSLLASSLVMLIVVVSLTIVLGPNAINCTLPTLMFAKIVSLGRFIERIDSVVLVLWMCIATVEFAMFTWADSIPLKQVFGLRTHTNLVLPLCGLMAAFSIAYCRQETVISDYLEKTRPLLTITVTLFVLGLLILSHLIKWSRRPN